jgi:hypothetical protein
MPVPSNTRENFVTRDRSQNFREGDTPRVRKNHDPEDGIPPSGLIVPGCCGGSHSPDDNCFIFYMG